MPVFVAELGVEEIPSGYLPHLIADLRQKTAAGLSRVRLDAGGIRVEGTPRRLAVWGEVAARQAPRRQTLEGPPLAVAFRDGVPTPAAEGFARRVGVAVSALGQSPSGRLVAEVDEPVAEAAPVLAALLSEVLGSLDSPHPMRWRADDVRFVRPVRWLLALLDQAVLPAAAFGLEAGRTTYGNRTDHPAGVALADAADYERQLRDLGVMLSGAERRQVVREQAAQLAEAVGGEADRPEVVDEVADLVEWPTVFRGRFDPAFLAVPSPILTTAMVHHQRYLPVTAQGQLQPYFIGARNGVGDALDQVIAGNERVLKARLADAAFFYDKDRHTSDAERRQRLARMTYREGLGSYQAKAERLAAAAAAWGPRLGLDAEEQGAVARAAALSKLDLVTQVVGEFPELEGVMGGVYATEAGEPPPVARAIGDQYLPRTAADPLPSTRVGRALSLLDHLDDLASGAALGVTVTGSTDPFGLRRAALAVGRLLVEGGLGPVDQRALGADALRRVGAAADPAAVAAMLALVEGRLRTWLADQLPADVLDAALAAPADWTSLASRLQMLTQMMDTPTWGQVATVAKRVGRLSQGVDPAPLGGERHPEPAAAALARVLAAADGEAAGGWAAWPAAAAALAEPVARFFDDVMVMDPDPVIRRRRLGLVAAVSGWLSRPLDWARVTSVAASPEGGEG